MAVLFQRGAFDETSVRLTAVALLYYGVGLWAFSAVRIVVSTFYALQDTRTPVICAAVSIVANAALGIALMRPLAHGGLALATSVSSMINLGLLLFLLRKKMGELAMGRAARSILTAFGAALAMGVVVSLLGQYMIPETGPLVLRASGLLAVILLGAVCYALLARVFKNRELNAMITMVKGYFKPS